MMQAQPQQPPREVELPLQFCQHRKKDGSRCGEPLFNGRLVKGSFITRRCHKCGESTTIAA